ncbi:uncharacterized protein BP5553_07939 [Venustampulla echinocandica]|uniref:Uncharacterized protein n=1 Tax=Venustampulla echinocandica TaxID=2656787 RepID=A0A370TFC2_9HELO|nr:uncharacterized protein BP5553_07939 [Venustampulla echinocandica]RDL33571.1 hypothetical protein BP5553_07939 [Venustampulla echinocandica]
MANTNPPKSSNGSKAAHNGSADSSSPQTSSHTNHGQTENSTSGISSSSSNPPSMERFLQEDRDHRSHAVAAYSPHQEDAHKRHKGKLEDVVKMKY